MGLLPLSRSHVVSCRRSTGPFGAIAILVPVLVRVVSLRAVQFASFASRVRLFFQLVQFIPNLFALHISVLKYLNSPLVQLISHENHEPPSDFIFLPRKHVSRKNEACDIPDVPRVQMFILAEASFEFVDSFYSIYFFHSFPILNIFFCSPFSLLQITSLSSHIVLRKIKKNGVAPIFGF